MGLDEASLIMSSSSYCLAISLEPFRNKCKMYQIVGAITTDPLGFCLTNWMREICLFPLIT